MIQHSVVDYIINISYLVNFMCIGLSWRILCSWFTVVAVRSFLLRFRDELILLLLREFNPLIPRNKCLLVTVFLSTTRSIRIGRICHNLRNIGVNRICLIVTVVIIRVEFRCIYSAFLFSGKYGLLVKYGTCRQQ
jgi:hypothetical protein